MQALALADDESVQGERRPPAAEQEQQVGRGACGTRVVVRGDMERVYSDVSMKEIRAAAASAASTRIRIQDEPSPAVPAPESSWSPPGRLQTAAPSTSLP